MFYRLYVDNNQIIDDTKGIKGQENLCLDIYILCQQEKKKRKRILFCLDSVYGIIDIM